MYEDTDEDVLALDFAIRDLARRADMAMADLAGEELELRQALVELDEAARGLGNAALISENRQVLLDVASALRESPAPDQSSLYRTSVEKARTGHLYSMTILTIGASTALILIALRIGALEVRRDGRGLNITFVENREKLSESLRGAALLIQRLFGGLATPPAGGTAEDRADPGP